MSKCEPSSDGRQASGRTYHICPSDHWAGQMHGVEYEPEQFESDGFVHCTHDRLRLMEIANTFYKHDQRPYLVLEIDLDRVPAKAVYEDPAHEFPHVYGRIPFDSVCKVRLVERGFDGSFLRIRDE